MEKSAKHNDKLKGCLLGGAIGDFVGSCYENFPLDHLRRFDLNAGRLTDDTQLSLATLESILEVGGVDPAHMTKTFVTWYGKSKTSGIGSSTLKTND